jgi:hypothetical protein
MDWAYAMKIAKTMPKTRNYLILDRIEDERILAEASENRESEIDSDSSDDGSDSS